MRLTRRAVLIPLAEVALIGVAWVGWLWIRPVPKLDVRRFNTMVSAGRYTAAEQYLEGHLRRDPDDSQARYLLATMLLDGIDDAVPERQVEDRARRALELLAGARFDAPAQAAMVALYEGKALHLLRRYGAVEARMLRALELDPQVPEAGWALLDLHYLQGRARDASELALRLHQVEPDPRDRVQLLLELVRQDSQPPDPGSLVALYRAAVEADPEDVRAAVTLGGALIRSSATDEGLEVLRGAVREHPDDPLAWERLLAGLDDAGRPAELVATLDRLPAGLADDPRFYRHRGRAAQERGDWPAAVDAYQRARDLDPHDPTLLYRLGHAQRFAGRTEEADRLLARHEDYKAAVQQVRPLYEEANAIGTLGVRSYPALYRRLGDLRARMLWPEQAEAWYRLAEEPSTPTS